MPKYCYGVLLLTLVSKPSPMDRNTPDLLQARQPLERLEPLICGSHAPPAGGASQVGADDRNGQSRRGNIDQTLNHS